jgi:hypothetical protein
MSGQCNSFYGQKKNLSICSASNRLWETILLHVAVRPIQVEFLIRL